MNKKNMKKAVMDQIILWIVLFVLFVTFLFFVIDYSNALKVKDNTDALADFLARKIALDNSNTDIASELNKIKDPYFKDIINSDINCPDPDNLYASYPDDAPKNYQVIVDVYATLTNDFLTSGSNNVHSKVVVFNENSDAEVNCKLYLSFK